MVFTVKLDYLASKSGSQYLFKKGKPLFVGVSVTLRCMPASYYPAVHYYTVGYVAQLWMYWQYSTVVFCGLYFLLPFLYRI